MRSFIIMLILFLAAATNNLQAQDTTYARIMIEKLSSPALFGRGYVNNGDILSARFISIQMKKHGIEPIGSSFLQPFSIPVNTFPDTLEVKISGQKLQPGDDYMVGGGSHSVKGTFDLVFPDTANLKSAITQKEQYQNKVVVLPAQFERDSNTYKLNAAGYVFTHKKNLYWRLSDATAVQPYFYVHTYDSLIKPGGQITVTIRNRFYDNYKTANVIGMIKGSTKPDSFYVFTAHYDHLGQMGNEVIFPGANDNASGTAMLMDLARHFSKPQNQPDYSMIFMAFAAEECGLFGSNYAAANPPVPLNQIKFLFNLDMVGSGSEGIGMVNAREVPRADSLIRKINNEHNLFNDIRSGGARCVSDHCAFAQKDVPAIFIFTRGKEYQHYHTPKDKGPVPLTKWNELFQLMTRFMKIY